MQPYKIAKSWMASRRQLLEQRLRFLQIARIKPFREPPVHGSQQVARLLHLALVAPEARELHGGAEFPRLGLLLTRDGEGALEIRSAFASSGSGDLSAVSPATRLISASVHLSLVASVGPHRIANVAPGVIELAKRVCAIAKCDDHHGIPIVTPVGRNAVMPDVIS